MYHGHSKTILKYLGAGWNDLCLFFPFILLYIPISELQVQNFNMLPNLTAARNHIDKMPNMVVRVAAHPLLILAECVAIDTLWKYFV